MSSADLSTTPGKSVSNYIRIALGAGGALALVVGLLVLFWPVKTAVFVAGVIAAYAALGGVVNIAVGVFSSRLGTWPRIGYLALGALFVIAALVAFANLQAAAAWLATVIGIMVGIVWIAEGVVGLTLAPHSTSRGTSIIFAVLSIVAGIIVLSSPLWGTAILWLLLGMSLVVLGIAQIARAFTFGRHSATTGTRAA